MNPRREQDLSMLALLVIAALVAAWGAAAAARGQGVEHRALPRHDALGEWTPQARIWLARGLVAEAGWQERNRRGCDVRLDHAAIPWVLARRWQVARQRLTDWTFARAVRAYCAGLGPTVRSARQRWVQSLPGMAPMPMPEGWPDNLSWPRHVPKWQAVLRFVDAWAAGEVADPTRGQAWHWGARDGEVEQERARRAIAAGRWYRVRLPGACNAFYGLRGQS